MGWVLLDVITSVTLDLILGKHAVTLFCHTGLCLCVDMLVD